MLYHACNKTLPFAIILVAVMAGCRPESNYTDLGAKPKAAFTVTPVNGKVNTYLLTSTTPNAFLFRWNIGDGAGFRTGTQIDTAYYPEKGDYTIKLLLATRDGMDSTTATVRVASDDPNGCAGNKALLTNCSTKTWVLQQPAEGALWVGDPGGVQWWASSSADITDRSCTFNDEYTFKKDGSFIFDNKGDIRVDDENGVPWPADIGLPIGCATMAQLPAKYQAWGSGNHTFKIISNNKLQVNGMGAYLGLYKVGENGTADTPESSVTFEILELTASKLVVRKMYAWGQWKFTFKAK